MNSYESLQEEARKDGVNVIDYSFDSKRIRGLYCDGIVAIRKDMTTTEKSCILAEELGHHHTTYPSFLSCFISRLFFVIRPPIRPLSLAVRLLQPYCRTLSASPISSATSYFSRSAGVIFSKSTLFSVLAENPTLIKRPIILQDGKALIGFNEKEYSTAFA